MSSCLLMSVGDLRVMAVGEMFWETNRKLVWAGNGIFDDEVIHW